MRKPSPSPSPSPSPTPSPAPSPSSTASKAQPISIAASLPSLKQAFGSVASDATGAALTIGAALFLTFPSNVFNSTFEDNYEDILAWWRKWTVRLIPSFLTKRSRKVKKGPANAGPSASATDEPLGGGAPAGVEPEAAAPRHEADPGTEGGREARARQRIWSFVAVLVAGGLLGSFLDPSWSLNVRTVISFFSIVVAMAAGAGISYVVSGGYHAARRHGRVPARLEALPAGLAVAALCVVISRATNFVPGYLYGAVCGVRFSRKLEVNEEGHLVALDAYVKVVLAVGAWALWAWFTHDATRPGGGVLGVLTDDFLASLFVSNMVSTVVSLFPVRFMPGHKLHQWHQGAWWATFGVSMFVLV